MATEIAMLHDVSKCTACRACMVACKQWKDLPAEITPFTGDFQSHQELSPKTYNIMFMKEYFRFGRLSWQFAKYQCMHCGDSACIRACPSKALYKAENGMVLLDKPKCVGCGACEAYCEFEVPKVDKDTKKSTKCDFCSDRVENGMQPACSKVCPTGTILFGTREEMTAIAEARVQVLRQTYSGANLYNVYTNNAIRGAHMMYIFTDAPCTYGFLANPKIPLSLSMMGGSVPDVPKTGLGAKVTPTQTAFAGAVLGAVAGAGAVLAVKLPKEPVE